mmetsp:Transcript_80710/g.98885  ORF Transcript_80710/g.98885 Transcript_80710/m.98885 type:complete len:113 (+) Transcript_80710:36-374(+)
MSTKGILMYSSKDDIIPLSMDSIESKIDYSDDDDNLKFSDKYKITFKLDVQRIGWNGMFWKTESGKNDVDQQNWPRNGSLLKGWYYNDKLIKLDNGKYMIIKYQGKTIMHQT